MMDCAAENFHAGYCVHLHIKLLGFHVGSVVKYEIPYFVDRASRYKFLLITSLTHLFIYLFISSLYMFRASSADHQEIELY